MVGDTIYDNAANDLNATASLYEDLFATEGRHVLTFVQTAQFQNHLSAYLALCSSPQACVTSRNRSEEHKSELQSLMRISYAVFCLKKKNKTNRKTNTTTKH